MGGRANWFRILFEAVRWRAGVSIATLLVAIVALASAAGGPLYLRAAEDSAIRSTLAGTAVSDSGLTLTAKLNVFGQGPVSPIQRLEAALSRFHADGLDRWFGPGIETTQISGSLPGDANQPRGYDAQLVARELACAHLSFTNGTCPQAAGQVALSSRSALQLHIGLGSPLVFQLAGKPAVNLTVVGVYQPADSTTPYWWNEPFFNYTPSIVTLSGETPFFLDSLFVTADTAQAVSVPAAAPTVTEEIPLVVSRVGQAEIQDLSAAVARYSAAIANEDNVTASTLLLTIVDKASTEQQSMSAIAGIAGAQLVLLALLVLYEIVSRSSEGREAEVALAKLRGYGFSGVLGIGLLEPLTLITLALPLGLLAAWLGVHALVGRLFTGGTRVDFDTLTIVAAAVAYLVAITAAAVAARLLILRPLSDQLHGARKPHGGRWAATLDLAVVVLAMAGLVELIAGGVLRSGQADPLALIAPGLLAIASAIVAMRLMPWLCRLGLAPTVGSRFVALFLTLRHAYRRPTALRSMLVLSIASSLTTFCVIGWTVADQNRAAVAVFKTGADRVLTVSTPAGSDLQSLVRTADPSGHQAMAALFHATGGGNLLAVDSSRLSAVAAWPNGLAGLDVNTLSRWLTQAGPPALLLHGGAVQLRIAGGEEGAGNVDLGLSVSDPSGQVSIVDLGPMVIGPHDYVAPLPQFCSTGCRLVAITPAWTLPRIPGTPGPAFYQQTSTIVLQLSGIQTAAQLNGSWATIDPSWRDSSHWVGSIGATVSVSNTSPAQVIMSFDERANLIPPPAVDYQDAAQSVPAVVTPDMVALNGAGVASRISVDGLDGRSLILNGAYEVPELPRVGSSGALVDISRVLHGSTGPVQDVVQQVWLSASAGASVLRALKAEGITAERVDNAASVKRGLDANGLSLSYDLLVLAGAAALAMAIAATAFNVLVTARRRSQEMAVMQAMGVTRRSLARGIFGEQMLVLGVGAIVGLASGLASVAITLPAVPEISGDQLLPLQYALPLSALVGLGAVMSVSLALLSIGSAVWILRLSVPARLRIALT